jgi:hypothetical protein
LPCCVCSPYEYWQSFCKQREAKGFLMILHFVQNAVLMHCLSKGLHKRSETPRVQGSLQCPTQRTLLTLPTPHLTNFNHAFHENFALAKFHQGISSWRYCMVETKYANSQTPV